MKFALWKYPVHFLAHGLGAGLIPFAPGTMGTLVAVALFWIMAPRSAFYYGAITVVLGFAGIFICGQTARDLGLHDPGVIVWDEIVGYLVAMYLLPSDWRWMLAGFVLYRLFDIWKPYPIRLVEQEFGVGVSIVADDIVAGIYTLAILHLARWGLGRFV
jgi:phosphatidylglycerophosphatase A